MESPKIAEFCRILWNGGIQRAAIAQTIQLRNRGLDCTLIFGRSVTDYSYSLPSGTVVLDDSSNRLARPMRSLFEQISKLYGEHRGPEATVDLDIIFGARHVLLRYDVVIYNDQYAALTGVWNWLIHGQPYILMFHEFYPKVSSRASRRAFFPIADLVDALSILVAPAIVTTSTKIRTRIERVVPGRVFLARLGCPPAVEQRSNIQTSKRGACSVTVWDRGRHPELLIEVARLAPEIRFTLAGAWGEETFRQEMEAKASALNNVTISGPLSESALVEVYKSNLIYIRFGYGESGPGMGGLEALSQGCLVVTNRELGISEVISNGTDGFVVPDLKPSTVAAMIHQILARSVEELQQLTVNALNLARELSWEAHGQVVAQAIERVVATERSATWRFSESPDQR